MEAWVTQGISTLLTPMSWTIDRDIIFCQEIIVSLVSLIQKKSSVECRKVWEAVADKLCDIKEPTFKVDQRAVRDHYKKLITRFKRKQKEEDLAVQRIKN